MAEFSSRGLPVPEPSGSRGGAPQKPSRAPGRCRSGLLHLVRGGGCRGGWRRGPSEPCVRELVRRERRRGPGTGPMRAALPRGRRAGRKTRSRERREAPEDRASKTRAALGKLLPRFPQGRVDPGESSCGRRCRDLQRTRGKKPGQNQKRGLDQNVQGRRARGAGGPPPRVSQTLSSSFRPGPASDVQPPAWSAPDAQVTRSPEAPRTRHTSSRTGTAWSRSRRGEYGAVRTREAGRTAHRCSCWALLSVLISCYA